MKTKHLKGFTLIELLFTIAIASVVLAFGLPALNDFRKNNQLRTLSMDLHTDLMLARTKSVERNIETIVCPSTNQSSCTNSDYSEGWITGIDEDGSGSLEAGEELLSVRQVDLTDITLSSTLGNTIQFDSRGFHPDASGVISICDDRGDDYAKSLSISTTGRISRGADPSC